MSDGSPKPNPDPSPSPGPNPNPNASAASDPRARERASDLTAFLDRGVTPFHAVEEVARRLSEAGYLPLSERDPWTLAPGDRRYVIRNGSSIIAFVVGSRSPAAAGFLMVGAHTDSPTFRVKPRPSYVRHGYRQIGVEVYGGVLLSTWLDRELSIAGRLAVRGDAGIEIRLVDAKRPICRIPNLAIHMNREVNREGVKINPQEHLPPILGLEAAETSEADLLAMLARQAEVAPEAVVEHELSLYDTQAAAIGGASGEFVFSARLDNLASCHAAVSSLLATHAVENDATRLIVLYDHEEVGSRSAQGAASPFLKTTVERIIDAHSESAAQGFPRAMAASFLVSADMAHAIHPNYADRHDPRHMPLIGAGPVIKTNASQSYATDGESAARFTALCREVGLEPQSFVMRSDLGCGTTIGPVTAAMLGVKTVDVGNPMLAMHSCREMAGVLDVDKLHRVLVAHFLTS